MTDTDTSLPAPEITAPQQSGNRGVLDWERGVCHTCGDPARDPRAYYCEEHKPAKKISGRGPGRPKGSTNKRAASTRPDSAPRAGRQASLRTQIQTFYEMIGSLVEFYAPAVGVRIQEDAPQIAIAWDAKAKTNAAIYSFWSQASDVGGWFAIAAAHQGVAMAVRDESRGRLARRQLRQMATQAGLDPNGVEQAAAAAAAAGMPFEQFLAQTFGMGPDGAPPDGATATAAQ